MPGSSEANRDAGFRGGISSHPFAAPDEALRCSRDLGTYFTDLVHHCPVALLILDPQHRVQACNLAFEKLFQYSREELLSGDTQELIATNELAPEAIEIWGRVLEGENVYAATQRRRKDGNVVDVELHGVPVIADGVLVGVLAFYHDVSRRKGAELALHQLSARLLELQDEERRRIARELHDTTAQSIFALTMNLTRLQALVGSGETNAQGIISDSLYVAEQSAKELRTLSYLLHPPLLDDVGLVSAISWYARGFSERSGIRVDLDLPADIERLPRMVELALFRILQEALTNVHRHSGSAVAVIRLVVDAERIMLEVCDQGRGFSHVPGESPEKLGVGLMGMRERIHQLGGQFEIISGRYGTTVRVAQPLPQ